MAVHDLIHAERCPLSRHQPGRLYRSSQRRGRLPVHAQGLLDGGFPFERGYGDHGFSNSKPPGERGGVIFVNETPGTFIRKLRRRSGKYIWLMGGGELARAFLNADLVDRLRPGVVPVLLGEGIPLFPSRFPQRGFRLIENKSYSKGLIDLTYERSRPEAETKILICVSQMVDVQASAKR